MGVLTIIVFPILGILLYWIVEGQFESFLTIFSGSINWGMQLLIGSGVGLLFGYLAWRLVDSNYMKPVLNKYGELVKSFRLNLLTIIFLSFCAGVGEEVFFRGVLQDYLGVVITAVIFVLIHGYLNPFDKIIFVYGLLMTMLIIGVGFMDKYLGLISAMAAHMMIDVVLFYQLTHVEDIEMTSRSDSQNVENNQ